MRLEQAEAARGLGAGVGPPVAPGRAIITCSVERQVDFHVAGRLALVRQRQLAGPLGLEDAAPPGRRRLPELVRAKEVCKWTPERVCLSVQYSDAHDTSRELDRPADRHVRLRHDVTPDT